MGEGVGVGEVGGTARTRTLAARIVAVTLGALCTIIVAYMSILRPLLKLKYLSAATPPTEIVFPKGEMRYRSRNANPAAAGPDGDDALLNQSHKAYADRAYTPSSCRRRCFADNRPTCAAFWIGPDQRCYLFDADAAVDEERLKYPARTYINKCDCASFARDGSGRCTGRASSANDACTVACCHAPAESHSFLLPGENLEFNQQITSPGAGQFSLRFGNHKQLELLEWDVSRIAKIGGYQAAGTHVTLSSSGEVKVLDKDVVKWSLFSSKLSDRALKEQHRIRPMYLKDPSLRLSRAGRLQLWGSHRGGPQKPHWTLEKK